jgi:hypothetical protein
MSNALINIKYTLFAHLFTNAIQSVRKVWNQWEFYLLFTLYAPCVHPDALRIFSVALPCFPAVLCVTGFLS